MRDNRVRRIFGHLDEPVDCIALLNGVAPHVDQSFFYATDLVKGGTFERAAALLWPDGRVEALVPPLEEESAREAPEAEIHTASTKGERQEWLKTRLSGLGRIGINAGELTVQSDRELADAAPQALRVDVGGAIGKARLVKDEVELARMQKAADIASAVAEELPGLLREGLREYELAAEIAYGMQRRGAGGPSFDTIVAFGAGSAIPHYHPGDVELRKGAYVLCDFGAAYHHYASDITRTFVFGAGSEKHRDVYETVLRAHGAALEALAPGVKGGDVHRAAADVIDASPYKGRFIHSVGHSLGLAVHDGGVLHPRMDLTLEEGMVVTIEPGIYLPGFGGVRIEDDVVVTKDGYRSLTNASHAYREI